MVDESDLEMLAQRRVDVYERLGELDANYVASRMVPGAVTAWPASALGCMRCIKRPGSRLLITDGLSDPYDPELHDDPPPGPLGFELGFDVLEVDPAAADDDALAESWFASALYPLSDAMIADWVDVPGALEQFGAITFGIPSVADETDRLADEDGVVGCLFGLPLMGEDIDAHVYVNHFYDGLGTAYDEASIGLFPVKLLTADEYHWAKMQGDEGARLLAERFIERGDGRLNWTERPSVLEQPQL